MRTAFHHFISVSDAGSMTAQSQGQEAILALFDLRMKGLKKAHGGVLGVWAFLNLVVGLFSIFTTSDLFFNLHFHAMNASWGLVNIGVAAFIYLHHNSVFDHPQTLLQQMDHQRHAEKMTMLNMGLDLAFITTGLTFYLDPLESVVTYPGLWEGFGASIAMQGTFLFLLDFIFHWLHVNNRRKVYPVWKELLDQIKLTT